MKKRDSDLCSGDFKKFLLGKYEDFIVLTFQHEEIQIDLK